MPEKEIEIVLDIEKLEIFEVKYHSYDSQATKGTDKNKPVQLNLFDSLKNS